jgi:hypothetical protein
MLLKFNTCIEHPEDPTKLVIPALFAEERPSTIEVGWRSHATSFDIIGRCYRLPFFPFGIFENIFVKFCQVGKNTVKFWKNGLLVVLENSRMLFELVEGNGKLNSSIEIQCLGKSHQVFGNYFH